MYVTTKLIYSKPYDMLIPVIIGTTDDSMES